MRLKSVSEDKIVKLDNYTHFPLQASLLFMYAFHVRWPRSG